MSSIITETNLRRHAEESAAKTSAARLSVITAGSLITLKIVTGYITGSISVWASMLDSAMDVFASMLNFIAVRAAARPADDDHAYGHGKAESLAGLFQALVIFGSGVYLIVVAIGRIVAPRPTESEWLGIATMIIAIIASLGLVARLRSVARATDSPALAADSIHYASDVYTNLGVLVALAISYYTRWNIVDPVVSIGIASYILWSAFLVARDSVDVLMDRRLPIEIDEQIAEIIGRFREGGVHGFHDLRTRRSGAEKFIEFHLEVERTMPLEAAHDLTEAVLETIEKEVERSHVQIHTDPS